MASHSASPVPPPLRLKFKAEREQHPNVPFTPEPFPKGTQDAYRY
jgi:hypothetical protein